VLVQAVSTRADGNMSLAVGDDPAAVRGNRRRFAEALELEQSWLVVPEQVHGGVVRRIGLAERGRGAWCLDDAVGRADALVTDEPGVVAMLTFADCVPVMLYDPRRAAIGVAHAGWKGSSLEIAAATVRAMAREFGSEPGDLRAAIGPAIGGCCYEVSDVVADAVGRAHAMPGPHGRPHVDLAATNRAQLLRAGLEPQNVEMSAMCTSCRVDRYFSHRAENGRAGRHVALIGLRP